MAIHATRLWARIELISRERVAELRIPEGREGEERSWPAKNSPLS